MTSDTKIKCGIESLLERLNTVPVPYFWLKSLGNHTAALLLADILSAYAGRVSPRAALWDGRELLLGCRELAAKLAISDRTLTRALQLLANRKAITYQRTDRVVDGKKRRNVVSVTPRTPELDREMITKLGLYLEQ
jgi:hypothetical protein